jgi:3-phosphoshikimate 1-carboxyvinyltransferase
VSARGGHRPGSASSAAPGADVVDFRPSGPLRGTVRAPGDKSITQRALLIGAVCDGPVAVEGPVWAGDPLATAGMVTALGAAVDGLAGREHRAVVHGAGLRGLRAPAGPLDAGNSGTGMRLLAGLLAGQRGRFAIDGDASLRRRPMARIVAPLRAMGARIEARDGDLAPLAIEGGPLAGIRHESPVASAQVKSCLLLAGLLAEGETVVVEPAPSRDHTERMLAAAGAPPRRRGTEVSVRGVERLSLERIVVPGDVSSAAFLVAAALLVPDSHLRVTGVGLNPTRLGFLEVARRMGGDVTWTVTGDDGGEPRGELEVRASALHGTTVAAAETPSLIDEVTLIALLGCFAEGDTVVAGVADLRAKESDRLAAVVEIVRDLGGRAEAGADGLRVSGGRLRGGAVESRGDHRLAMLGAVAGLACPDGVRVSGFSASAVTFPGFADCLAEVLPS